MGFALQAAMDAGPLLRVGNMRFSAFGVCTLVGLLTAFWLMRWTATMAGLERRPVVDAGWFGVLAGLVVSRLLLIVSEPTAFLHYPLLILSLPSFTYVGMALTVVALLAYLRWKKLPLAKVLDAWAPCAALMAAALSVGYFFEGTHVGMPTALPWGVLDARFGRVHPVQMYDAVAAVWLCALLLWRLSRAHVPGAVAREALMLGGIGFFVLAMFRQPDPGTPHAWLEPGQWVALATITVGILWLTYRPTPSLTREDVATLLEEFAGFRPSAHKPCNAYEVICYETFTDPLLLELQTRFSGLPDEFPPNSKRSYCSEAGIAVLLEYAKKLRATPDESNQETP